MEDKMTAITGSWYDRDVRIAHLEKVRAAEVDRLRNMIAAWRREHGWIMRPLCRGYVRNQIKEIRAIDYSINSWRKK